MGRRTNSGRWTPPQGPFPCWFNCGRSLRTKYDRQAIEGWEWFTGYGADPLHFCPSCRRTRQFDIDRIREHMNKRPDGYPAVRVQPPASPSTTGHKR
jgi:hypothetical protein